jgi:RNA polymerase sigma-70 factor (ECF subfamily)
VLRLVDTLAEPDRSLLYLRDAEGMDLKSLARAFGLREGTVKSKLARARLRVRDKALRAWGDR